MNTFLLYLFFRWEDTSFHSSVSTFVVVGGMKRDFIYQNRLHWNAVESRLNDKINANPMHYDTLFANRGFRIKKAFTRPPTNEPTEKKNVYHKGNNLDHNTKYGSNYTHSQFFLVFSGNFYVINFFLVQTFHKSIWFCYVRHTIHRICVSNIERKTNTIWPIFMTEKFIFSAIWNVSVRLYRKELKEYKELSAFLLKTKYIEHIFFHFFSRCNEIIPIS